MSSTPLEQATTTNAVAIDRRDTFAAFMRGYLALLPLWSGAIPAGIAYGVAARAAGLGVIETQVMSLTVFSAAGQIGAVSLLAGGASPGLLIGTVMALNAQLLLLGVAIGRQLRLSWPERFLAAWLLTDGAYGVSLGVGPLRLAVLVGAGASMYTGWNIGTLLGAVLGAILPSPRAFGIDLVAPLSFLAVLVPLLRTRPMLLVACVAGLTALLLLRVAPGGVAVLGAGLVGCAAGAWATRHEASSRASAGEGMTGELWLILGMGAGVYALRIAGLVLRDFSLPAVWDRALRFVPVALLTGLVVVGLNGQVSAEPMRLLAVAAAALAAWRTGKMWACILAGMAAYWLLAWLLG